MKATGKILVVDDDISVCKALSKFLKSKGYDVVEAHSGDECIEKYSQKDVLLVLLDLRMPRKDGLETIRELKAIDPKVNVLILTAAHEEELARQLMTEGALDYLTKPIDPGYLESVLLAKIESIGKKK